MAYHRFADDEYWQNCPPELQSMRADNAGKVRNAYFIMGDKSADPPTVMIMDLQPGETVRRHFHDCARVEVVIRGEIYVDGQVLSPGDVMTAAALEAYGPHVAGPRGATTAEIFGAFHAACEANYPTDAGVVTVDLTMPGAMASRPPLPSVQ
jgi:hypothetical protein